MCGRYVRFSDMSTFAELFSAKGKPAARPSYNIPPSSQVLVARYDAHGQRELALLKWGLVPSWSSEPRTEFSTINARAETIADKPAFRSAFKQRRCLIAADGFFEWHKESDGHKQPYFFRLIGGHPFAFAGIWERWERDSMVLETCSIIVTVANEKMRPIHPRMPVILEPEDYDAWMDPKTSEAFKLQRFLRPMASERMECHRAPVAVNNPKNDTIQLISPA
ncbi:MAG: hypothetical protein RL333_54 [Pseudomonadota bacterium]|jgi:putative SOS response-associated peptidase YedK